MPVLRGWRDGALAAPLEPVWVIGWFGYLNWVLMLANMIPALPFDMGRMVRAWPGSTSVVPSRDSIVAPYLARALCPGDRDRRAWCGW